MQKAENIPVFRLNTGANMPAVGLGVYQMPDGPLTRRAVDYALRCGYRHIDTAMIYRNETSVGQAVNASFVAREDLFITTKLWNSDQGYEQTIRAFQASLQRLNLSYIDLYLIHWPVHGKRKDSWKALETLYQEGKCRAIGVSNYMTTHLDELLGYCRVMPAVNQIELHPFLFRTRAGIVELCRRSGILPVAYSPLTKATRLRDERLVKMAAVYGKSPARILLRWALQQGFAPIPKSSSPARIAENIDVFDFTISPEDMEVLNAMDENLTTGWDPSEVL
jgi:diketogulonate reductase-like aldo/keto reductase